MKSGLLFFFGLLAAVTFSWASLVLGAHGQLGALAPFYDDMDGMSFPHRPPGIASRGQLVYADLGCASCHTQQVRRPGFGPDRARGWGDRQSVARDYIYQIRPQLGASRIGPDLANLATRKPSPPSADQLYDLLRSGSATHPAYAFLFTDQPATVTTPGHLAAVGGESVSTERARSLVAYLLSLNQGYEYPEARPVTPPASDSEEGAKE
jgi:cytochrome c oxidase cbb3-type subunit 2